MDPDGWGASERIKVIYISGQGRSGSTLLGNILGQHRGFFFGGELRYIWERGFIENRRCGCGVLFCDCVVWRHVIGDQSLFLEGLSPQALDAMSHHYSRTARLLSFGAARGNPGLSIGFIEYLHILEKLYRSISRQTGSHVIVDTSKYPVYGPVLQMIPSLDVYTVHLIRDPRAIAYSSMTPKITPDFTNPTLMPKVHPVVSAAQWGGWNLAVDYLRRSRPGRYFRLAYEDFVLHPRSSTREILDFVHETPHESPFQDEYIIRLKQNHTVSGNPDRFQVGVVEIRPDIRWYSNMPLVYKIVVSLLVLPLLNYFGYSIWARKTRKLLSRLTAPGLE